MPILRSYLSPRELHAEAKCGWHAPLYMEGCFFHRSPPETPIYAKRKHTLAIIRHLPSAWFRECHCPTCHCRSSYCMCPFALFCPCPPVKEFASHPCSSAKSVVKVTRPVAVRDFCWRLGATTEHTVVVCKGIATTHAAKRSTAKSTEKYNKVQLAFFRNHLHIFSNPLPVQTGAGPV
jgi:hypothetical protein